jgi:hypothetical protein
MTQASGRKPQGDSLQEFLQVVSQNVAGDQVGSAVAIECSWLKASTQMS